MPRPRCWSLEAVSCTGQGSQHTLTESRASRQQTPTQKTMLAKEQTCCQGERVVQVGVEVGVEVSSKSSMDDDRALWTFMSEL